MNHLPGIVLREMDGLLRFAWFYGDFISNQGSDDVVSVPSPTARRTIKVMSLMGRGERKSSLYSLTSFLNHILQMDLLGIFKIHLSAFHRIS